MGRELFAPDFGLFNVSANKCSLQPNPISSLMPNFPLYFEFAGLILAKLPLFLKDLFNKDCQPMKDERLMDILKHITGRRL